MHVADSDTERPCHSHRWEYNEILNSNHINPKIIAKIAGVNYSQNIHKSEKDTTEEDAACLAAAPQHET